jgi:hypothetical protein
MRSIRGSLISYEDDGCSRFIRTVFGRHNLQVCQEHVLRTGDCDLELLRKA